MVSLNIKKVLLLISLMNAIAAYSNDTSYSYLYNSGIDSTPSYSISAMHATESSNNVNGETSSPETTTLAGQYSESGRISSNGGQSSTTSQQYTAAAVTVRNSDFMSKSTTLATPSSSSVPTSIHATNEVSSLSQIYSYDTMSLSKSELSELSSSLSTSDSTTVPRGTNPIITTTFSSSKGEITPTQTSGASRTASLTQVVPGSSQVSRMTLTTTAHVSSGETTQTQFFSTISSMISTEEYTVNDFSEYYDSGFTNYPDEELIVEYSSSSSTTIVLSSKGESTSTKTSDASHAASLSQVVLGASQISHITSTITTYSASTTQTQPSNSISSIRPSQASSTTEWETSEDDGSVFTKYPNQELIVDYISSSSLTRAVSSSMISQSTPTESNSITISSNLGQNPIITSIPYGKTSTSSTIPSASTYTSSPAAAVASSASAYTSSPAAAIASSASAYTSSPAGAVASSASAYTPSPAAAVASSASAYTPSPAAAVASSASAYTPSPAAAVASSASAYTPSPAAAVASSASAYTPSPAAAVASSASAYTPSPAAAVASSASAYTPSPAAAIASTYTSSPAAAIASSASAYTSSPAAAVASSASAYTSSPAGAVAPSASAYTSSPAAAIASTYTSSPAAAVASSASAYTSSPAAAVASSASAYTSSPAAAVASSASAYTSSPAAAIASSASAYTSSPAAAIASSASAYTSSPAAAIASSASAYTSSPAAAIASSASAYTSSPAAAVASSASAYTSSPAAAVASSTSAYTSSPATAVASSASAYTSSPAAAVAPSASAYTSSPAAVAPSYTSSSFTYAPAASTQTISPSSSATTYAPGLSSVRSLSTSATVTPVISIHTMSSEITASSQQVSATPYKTMLQSRPISPIPSDATFSSTVSIISMGSFASNRVETSPLSSPTQFSSTYVTEPPKSSTPLVQLSSGTEASYMMTSQNIAISSKSTTTRQPNLPYVSSTKTSDNEFFSTTLQTSSTGSTKIHIYTSSISASRHSIPQIAASDVSGSSKDPGSHTTSLYYSASSISSKNYSKETSIVTKSSSDTQERLTGSARSYQSNSQPSISKVKTTVNTQNHVLTTASSSTLSKSANSKAGSISSSNKLSKTITNSQEKLSLTTRKTSHDSSLKTGESNFGVSTKLSTNTISIVTQTQAITDSKSVTAIPSTYATGPYTTSNGYAWLPTAIIVEPSKSDTSTTSFNPSITASLPNVIEPAIAVSEPANHTLVTIGFTAGLNYAFLVRNPLSSAQIFNFLPSVLKYPFSDTTSQPEESSAYEMGSSSFVLSYQSGSSTTTLSTEPISSISIVKKKKKGGKNSVISTANLNLPSIGNSSIVVKQIVPMIDSSRAYVIAVAEVYFPIEAISFLQELILDTNSTLYNNPQNSLQTLAGLIDSSIPLGGLYGSNDGCSICDSSSSSVSESSNKNSTENDGTNKYGALDDFTNSLTDHMPWKITKRFIIYLTCLTAGVLLWLLLALFAFRHRNVLLGRRPRNCIEKTPNNERELEGIGVSTSRSSSDNHNYNEKKPKTESESFHSVEDDQYIPTGENTVFSATHGLHYIVDEDGDLFYRKSMPNDFDEINENEDSGIDSILRECVYDKHQETTEVYLNDEESISSNLDVDENGNIRLYDSYSEDDEPNCPHLQDEVIEDYNNSHVYKMQHQGFEIGSYTTEDDPDTENLITNEFSSGSQTCLPSTAYTTPLDTNSIKLHILGHAGSSLQKPDQAFLSNHEELEIEDIDDNGSVSDIQVEELDALDEELYKRMSKIVKQQNN
ncbi:hypothetical protein SUVZ_02G5300 [Saccharomyces uvarum]|uniref:Uncharacterized protein n=1 Tax=Saccharomyces uvarum TaxID=230603 RepID=A0ABN8WVT0_SACUV|nr:hypothetical protein SUVZ_02G5300 [Saccharomyces uvarum]